MTINVSGDQVLASWKQLAADIASWEGELEAGRALVHRGRALPALQMKLADPGLDALRTTRGNIVDNKSAKLSASPVEHVRVAAHIDPGKP
jgi:hypothetical protein